MKSLVKKIIKLSFPYLIRLRNYYDNLVFENLDTYHSVFGIVGVTKLLLHAGLRHNPNILRHFGATIGEGTRINSPLTIDPIGENYSKLAVGKNCWLGAHVALDLMSPIVIGNNVTISRGATIITHVNVLDSPLGSEHLQDVYEKVVIGDGCFVGANVIILYGVTVGECAVLGAGAVVKDDVPPYSLAVGVPAKVVKRFDS